MWQRYEIPIKENGKKYSQQKLNQGDKNAKVKIKEIWVKLVAQQDDLLH